MPEADDRVPVVFGPAEAAEEGDALLIEGEMPAPPGRAVARYVLPEGGHASGCACCVPRGPAAEALACLFLARVRGEAPFFTRVVAVAAGMAGRAAVADALRRDPLARARFRFG